MRTRVTVVCLSVCLLPLYCLRMMCVQQIERTSQVYAELQKVFNRWISLKSFLSRVIAYPLFYHSQVSHFSVPSYVHVLDSVYYIVLVHVRCLLIAQGYTSESI